jgi:hypothetical protein
MGPDFVIFLPPLLNYYLRFKQGSKHLSIEQFTFS